MRVFGSFMPAAGLCKSTSNGPASLFKGKHYKLYRRKSFSYTCKLPLCQRVLVVFCEFGVYIKMERSFSTVWKRWRKADSNTLIRSSLCYRVRKHYKQKLKKNWPRWQICINLITFFSVIVSGVSPPVFTCCGLFPWHKLSMCELIGPILNLVGHLSHCRFSDTVLGNMYVLSM